MSIFSKFFKGGSGDREDDDEPRLEVIDGDDVEAHLDDDALEENTVVESRTPLSPPAAARAKARAASRPASPAPAAPATPPVRASRVTDDWSDLDAPIPPLRAGGGTPAGRGEPARRAAARAQSSAKQSTGAAPPAHATPVGSPSRTMLSHDTPSKVLYAGTPFERTVPLPDGAPAATPTRANEPPSRSGGTPVRPGAAARAPQTPRQAEPSPGSTSGARSSRGSPSPQREREKRVDPPRQQKRIAPIPEALTLDVDAELDAIFDDVTDSSAPTAKRRTESERARVDKADAEAARATFLEVAALHLRQAREAMIEIRHGRDPRPALGPATKAVEVVADAARTIGDTAMCDALDALSKQLREAESAGGSIGDTRRAAIVSAYRAIPLPDAQLDLDAEHERREAVIVRALLGQVPDLEKVGIEKMFGAGLGRLQTLLAASADDIAATTGIEEATTRRVVETIAAHTRELGGSVAAPDPTGARARLEALLGALREEHEAFERAAAQWTDASFEEKRRRRVARGRLLLQVDVVLAQLGEVDHVYALGRLPVHRRIARLDGIVRERGALGAAPA